MNPTRPQNNINRVAVIGAGPAGLTAVKCLRDVGLEAIAFEKNAQIGGVWNFDENASDGGGIAYRSLKTNTAKDMTAFSDFPFPQDLPTYPHRSDVLAYFNSYADNFGLRPFIHLNTAVKQITRQENGQWSVTYQPASGTEQSDLFDAVVVANGFYQKTVIPNIPGLDDFQGQIMHSAQFKGPEPFTDQRVVVIGSGSSGVDVAAEVGKTAASVDIVIRTGVWIVPRHETGKPLDSNMFPISGYLPGPLKKYLFKKIAFDRYQEIGLDKEQIANKLKLPPYTPDKTRVTASTALLKRIRDGRVTIKGEIERITVDGIRYKDGSTTTADTLIFCTGYAPSHPFLDPDLLQIKDDYSFGLYRHVFHPEYDTLAFLAQCRVAGPVFPVMEMQARWISAVFSGTAELPPPAIRKQHITNHFAESRQKGKNPMRVQHTEYMNEIAAQFGAKPKLLNHLQLLPQLIFGPQFPPRFRLDGPDKSDNAEELIRRYNSNN